MVKLFKVYIFTQKQNISSNRCSQKIKTGNKIKLLQRNEVTVNVNGTYRNYI